jgi:hypothetical protein
MSAKGKITETDVEIRLPKGYFRVNAESDVGDLYLDVLTMTWREMIPEAKGFTPHGRTQVIIRKKLLMTEYYGNTNAGKQLRIDAPNIEVAVRQLEEKIKEYGIDWERLSEVRVGGSNHDREEIITL